MDCTSRRVLSTAVLLVVATAGTGQQIEFEQRTVEGGGKTLAAEFGYLEVPENRSDATSRKIRLAIMRVKSPKSGPPTFVLAGGPGGSSVDNVKGIIGAEGDAVFEILPGDLVGIDQRGVGASRPSLSWPVPFGISAAEPGDRDKWLALAIEKSRTAAEEWRDKGFDLAGYTTVESADDIDAVRRALGYDKMILWGGSYGSHLAFATLRRHGTHIERVIARGPEGPDHTIKLPSYAQDGLQRISKLVAEDPQLGQQLPDLMQSVESLLAKLEEEPVFIDGFDPSTGKRGKIGISKFDVQRLLANAIGRVRTMRPVPAWVHAMSQGNFQPVMRDIMRNRMGSGTRPMSAMMDGASGVSAKRAARIAREAKTCLLGDAVNFPFPDIGRAWGAPDLGDEFRGPLHSNVPVLFVCGDLDSRTPVCNAEELMKHLPNAHLIVVENAAHDLGAVSLPELKTATARFMRGEPVQVTRITAPKPRFNPIRER